MFGSSTPSFGTSATPNVFGNTSTNTSSLFGSTAPSTTGFGASSTPATSSTPSLFGGGTATPTSSLFGSSTTQTTTSPFGSSTASTPFGGTSSSTSSSLFGGSTNSSATSSLFGGSSTSSQFAPASSSSSSLFGNTSFGATPSSTPSLFSASTPSAVTAPAGQQITFSTKFSDLPPQWKQVLEKVQTEIHDQRIKYDDLTHHSNQPMQQVEKDIKDLSEQLISLLTTFQVHNRTLENMKEKLRKELKNAELAARTVERLKSPNISLRQQLTPDFTYFQKVVETFEQRMREYRLHISNLEEYVRSSFQPTSYTPKMLQSILRNQHEFFVALSSQVAVLHETISELRRQFLVLRKATGKSQTDDPFQNAVEKKGHKGITIPPPTPKAVKIHQQQQQQQQQQGTPTIGTPNLGFGSGFGAATTGSFGSSSPFGSSTSLFSAPTSTPLFSGNTSTSSQSSSISSRSRKSTGSWRKR